MNKRLLMSVAAAALIAGTGIANAQSPDTGREAPAAGSTAKPAPSADRAAPTERSGTTNKDGTTSSDSRNPAKAGNDIKAEGRGAADTKGADTKSATTTGQAGAAGKLSTEQRSKITTVIQQQKIQPATNVNFSISVGTRVPRDVGFHPLPAEIVTLYPDWRGYEFFLVRDEIIVVNPRTLEIVAVLPA